MNKKPKVYRSPESRAKQLAGLSGVKIQDHVPGVEIEKINGKGSLASVTEDIRKAVLDLYSQGNTCSMISERLGLTIQMTKDIKNNAIDQDPVFRETMHKQSLRERLKIMVSGSVDRLNELMPNMSAKDAALAMGIGLDKLLALEKTGQQEVLHQHLHLHAPSDIAKGFMEAMKPADELDEGSK